MPWRDMPFTNQLDAELIRRSTLKFYVACKLDAAHP